MSEDLIDIGDDPDSPVFVRPSAVDAVKMLDRGLTAVTLRSGHTITTPLSPGDVRRRLTQRPVN